MKYKECFDSIICNPASLPNFINANSFCNGGMTAAFQGCTIIKEQISNFQKNAKKFKNAEYRSAQNEAAFLVDAIKRKDAQAIKDKFSLYAQDNIDNLDAKIDRLIEDFPGWNDDYEVTDTFERWSNHGKITYMLTPSFDFDVDDKTYRMRIILSTIAN